MATITVFTPAHDGRYLDAALDSLLAQTFEDFEWLIVLNRGAEASKRVRTTSFVRIHPLHAELTPSIGALKREACLLAKGDVLLELDHDDTLRADALQAVADAYGTHGDAFFYSDFINVRDNESVTWQANGWESYPVNTPAGPRRATRAFDAAYTSLWLIYYAPNHLRAWSKNAYWAAGGHDPGYAILDDQDLLIRTYLAGVKFVHLPQPLYTYRFHAGNTCMLPGTNAQIQRDTYRIGNNAFYRLLREWLRREALPAFRLTRVGVEPPGFVQLADIRATPLDLSVLSTLPDNSVGCLVHVATDTWSTHVEFDAFLREAHRVLSPGGCLSLRVPSSEERAADLFRCNLRLNERSLQAIDAGDRFRRPNIPAYYACRVWGQYPDGDAAYVESKLKYACCDLVALKGQRQAGFTEIA